MNKEELQIAKAIAEFEGVDVEVSDSQDGLILIAKSKDTAILGLPYRYEPFDWSVLGVLMFKYKVEVNHCRKEVEIWPETADECDLNGFIVESFDGTEKNMKLVILECILKANK